MHMIVCDSFRDHHEKSFTIKSKWRRIYFIYFISPYEIKKKGGRKKSLHIVDNVSVLTPGHRQFELLEDEYKWYGI